MATIKISFPFKKHFFDKKATQEGLFICGVDEAGRGCLAGPVVTAALVLKPKLMRKGRMPSIDDSKILTAEQRELAYQWLQENSWFGTATINHRIIDSVNIYQATLRAMRRAVIQMCLGYPRLKTPAAILVDAMPLDASFLWPASPCQQCTQCAHAEPCRSIKRATSFDGAQDERSGQFTPRVIKKGDPQAAQILENPWNNVLYFYYGEERSQVIAAASIIAKVTRDRIMKTMAPLFPQYSFDQHKGYAVPSHKKQVTERGRSIIHRLTYNSTYPDFDNVQSAIDFQNLEAGYDLSGQVDDGFSEFSE